MEKNNNTSVTGSARASKVAARQSKKRAVVSYANMSPELAAAFKEKYPKGYADYMGDIFKVDKPNGDFFYAVSIEIPEAIYLVKIDVKVDDYEDVENGLFGDNSEDNEEGTGDGTFPENEGGTAFGAEEDSDE